MTIRSNHKNLDLGNAPLKKEAEEFLAYLRKTITELELSQTDEARRQLAQRRRDATHFLADPKNYERLALTPVARERVDLLKRKIAVVNEYLEGPSA